MTAETPEEFWYENLNKYRDIETVNPFPQNIIVTSLVKMSQNDVVVLKGHLKDDQSLVLTYPVYNGRVRNFIGVGIGYCDYKADTSVEVYELDYNLPMTDDFVIDLLTKSHAWEIHEYWDLSEY